MSAEKIFNEFIEIISNNNPMAIPKKVTQETRGWDEKKQSTFSQRLKEESHDYRYFPDPDLPKLKLREIKEWSETNLKKELPELPWEKRGRLIQEYGIKKESAEMFMQDEQLGMFFESLDTLFDAPVDKAYRFYKNKGKPFW